MSDTQKPTNMSTDPDRDRDRVAGGYSASTGSQEFTTGITGSTGSYGTQRSAGTIGVGTTTSTGVNNSNYPTKTGTERNDNRKTRESTI
jgi:hypothetical protein